MNIVLDSVPSSFGLVDVALIVSLLLALTAPLIYSRIRGEREVIMPLVAGLLFAYVVGVVWTVGYSFTGANSTEELVTQEFEQSQSVTHLTLDADQSGWVPFQCTSSEKRHAATATWVDGDGQYQVGVLAMDARESTCHYELLVMSEN